MEQGQLNWITNYIWGIADDVLRDLFVRGKYRDVILPMTVLRRLDAVLEDSKQAVLDMKTLLEEEGVVEHDPALRMAAGQAFYNTSKFTLRDLRARANRQQLKADFEAYLDGFSRNVQDILDNFEFRNQIPRLSKADALGTLIEKLTSPEINLSPEPIKNGDGSVKHPGLDNHGMGSIFEELVRKFNEENNEEAGEHWTPRDAVKLMAKLIFLPIADEIESGTYLLYDGACGTGGMLTVAEETLKQLARREPDVRLRIAGLTPHLRSSTDQRPPHRKNLPPPNRPRKEEGMSRSAWIEDWAGRTHNGKKVGGRRWRARYRSPDRKIRSKSFARKPDAQRWLDQQVAALGNGAWVDPERGRLLFSKWAAQVMGSRAHLAETTRSRDDTYLRTMVLPHLGNLPLAQIRPSDLRAMVAALSADGKAPATVRKAYQLAALILRLAVSDDLIARSPARGIDLPSMRETETEMRFLDHTQVAELHEAIHPRFRVAVSLGAYAGLRLGEATGLRVDNLDLLHRRLTVTHSLVNLNGRAELGPTKTKASRRTIPIGQRLCDELAAHLTEFGTGPQGVVLSSPQGSWVRASSWRYRFWHPAVETSVGRPLRYHDLRHTHAAFLIAQGEHPKAIQDRLGHSSIVVTMDTYGHLLPGVAAEVADRLDQAAASATETQHEHEISVLATHA